MRLDPRTDLADSPFRREQRILGLIAKYEALGMRGALPEDDGTATPTKGSPRPKMTPAELKARRKAKYWRAKACRPPKPDAAKSAANLWFQWGLPPEKMVSRGTAAGGKEPNIVAARRRVWSELRDQGFAPSTIGRAFKVDHRVVRRGVAKHRTERMMTKPPAQVCRSEVEAA